ncbi:MAG: alpha/beta fold hydrolase [Bryobacteraceae bacterium]
MQRALSIAFLLYSAAVQAQIPADIQMEQASIYSEGTRMAAEKYFLKSNAGKKLPTVLMAHGWGGTMRALRPDAIDLAKAGYFVVAFDYRGWGESDARLLLTGPAPEHKKGETFPAQVKEVREVVDPLDFGADWLNAIHWMAGEPMADMQRLGLWGSSFSGGLVVWAAARDSRVKAVHSQVGSLDGRGIVAMDKAKFYDDSTKRARGEIGYPAPLAQELGKLRGAPIRSRFADYAPVEDIGRAPNCAMQFVIAEKEELFDNRDHAIKAHARHTGPKRLITVPNITHYGIYYEARKQAQQLAREWFDQHLKAH